MKVKGTGSRMASNPDQEPNFYIMSSMPSSVAPSAPDGTPPSEHQQDTSITHSSKLQEADSSSNKIMNDDLYTPPLPASVLSSEYQPQSVVSSSKIATFDGFHTHLPPSLSNDTMYYEKAKENEPVDMDVVFDNMHFHALSDGSRRHSLMMEPSRRLSMRLGRHGSFRNQRGSLILDGDVDFDKEMEMIACLGENSMSDNEMGDILDKIIDHRIV